MSAKRAAASAARHANHARLVANGWPTSTDNRRYFHLKPYGRVWVAYVQGKGFWMHLEGDDRVAFGQDNDAALKALVRILEPDVEQIEIVDAVARKLSNSGRGMNLRLIRPAGRYRPVVRRVARRRVHCLH
jgi:hypothetical protein